MGLQLDVKDDGDSTNGRDLTLVGTMAAMWLIAPPVAEADNQPGPCKRGFRNTASDSFTRSPATPSTDTPRRRTRAHLTYHAVIGPRMFLTYHGVIGHIPVASKHAVVAL